MEDNKSIFSDTYEVIDYLQSGSGGMVYKAYHKRLKKEVVLKRIKKKSANMKINRQEVDILKNLNHMYLPQVLDFLSVDGEIFTVISFVPGKSFKELLDEGAHFKKKQLICWGMQLCSALHYLHNQNPPIIHGDIKPANMMLTPQGNICLIDFNISFFMDDSMVWGYTEGYTSPEQYIVAVDKKSASAIPERSIIDEKSDIYSVGATFYHLITGEKLKRQRDKLGNHMRSPFMPAYPQEFNSQDSRNALLKRMSEAPVPLPDAIPKNLGRVILKALETKKYRYCSAEKFKDELLKVKKSLSNEQLKKSLMKDKSGTTTSIDLDNSVPIKESNKRIKRWILALSVMGLLGIGVLTSVFISHKHSMELQQSWKKGSIVPFITISMEMTEKDFKNYYGKRFTEGIDGQYYLEMPDEEGGFATVTFSEGMLISVSYSFERSEDQWKEICDDFYQKWMIEGDEWPYIAEKEEVRVVLDYDKPNKEASLFLKRIE